jgi:hypothetical protein
MDFIRLLFTLAGTFYAITVLVTVPGNIASDKFSHVICSEFGEGAT